MFRSFAQNLEDVLLRRALSGVENGVFVDIGAGHPIVNSVTKGFSELGWRGVNVEPLADRYIELCNDRPLDTNIRAVVLGEEGSATLFHAEPELGAYSTTDLEVRDDLVRGGFVLTPVTVPSLRLGDVLALLPEGDIHFLKVDVEGAEREVLRSHDFAVRRPWIIVVEIVAGEARRPGVAGEINRMLGAVSYENVFFDGLNAYYLAAERADELRAEFAYPVCVRDKYLRPLVGPEAATALTAIAETLQCESSEPSEVLERLTAFVADRFAEAESLRDEIAELTTAATQAASQAVEQGNAAVEAAARAAEDASERISTLSASLDAARRDRFARERYVAFLAAQLETSRANHEVSLGDVAWFHAELHAVKNTFSWRVTRGLRGVRSMLSRIRRGRR